MSTWSKRVCFFLPAGPCSTWVVSGPTWTNVSWSLLFASKNKNKNKTVIVTSFAVTCARYLPKLEWRLSDGRGKSESELSGGSGFRKGSMLKEALLAFVSRIGVVHQSVRRKQERLSSSAKGWSFSTWQPRPVSFRNRRQLGGSLENSDLAWQYRYVGRAERSNVVSSWMLARGWWN